MKAQRVGLPSRTDVDEIANRRGMALSEQYAQATPALLGGFIASYERVLDLAHLHPSLPRKHGGARTGGRAPTPAENELNGWHWITDIEGEAEGALRGKQVAVKDNVCVAGMPFTNGSRALEGYTATEDATVVQRLLAAGACIKGIANNEDLCLSGGSFTCAHGPVKNPHDPTRQTGGSSSGSGCLVASGAVDLAIACDQGGSIRIPACWCGVVGFKPTHGLVPYTGIFSMEATLDHCGPIARTVSECAAMLQVIAGADGYDARQHRIPHTLDGDYTSSLPNTLDEARAVLAGARIGVLQEGFGIAGGVSEPEVDEAVRAATRAMAEAGATVSEVSVPLHLDGGHIWTPIGVEGIRRTQFQDGGQNVGVRGYCVTSMQRAMHKGINDRGVMSTISFTNKLFMALAEFVQERHGAEYYGLAQNLVPVLKKAYEAAMDAQKLDVLVMPTLPKLPTPLPEPDASGPEYVGAALNMIANTATFNATGHPALTVPVKFVNKLPVGMMLVGRDWSERRILEIARAYELVRGDTV